MKVQPRLLLASSLASRIAGLVAVIVGVVVLLAWKFDVLALKGLLPGFATMKANTAVGFVCAGSALLTSPSRTLLERVAGIACSIAIALLGVMTLSQYVGGWNLGIDEMLFADAGAPEAPGRMAPMSALGFLLAGTALGLLRLPASRRDNFAQICAVLLLAFSLVTVAGYAFGAADLYRLGPYVGMALHTALTFMVLSLGILLAYASRGWMPVFISDGVGGAMLRRLLLPSLATLFAVAYLRLWGERFGWYDTEVGLSLMVILSGALLSVLIWRNATALNRLYETSELDKARLRESDARLLQVEALQHAIVTSPNFAIIATDVKGIIQLFNVGAERMLGFRSADIINKIRPSEMHDPREVIARAAALSAEFGTTIAPGFEALVYKASRGLEDVYEKTYIRKDGSTFPAMVSTTPLRDDDGEVIGYLLIGTDISERRAAEMQMIEAKRVAENANSAKTNFLASMSHELRTPLNAILGFAQLMDSDSPARTPSDRRSVGQILKAGWYLLDLINEILDLALIESGKATISREPIALAAVLLECQAMVEAEAKKRGLGITFPPIDIPYAVKADLTRLKQILVNLLTNAIKYNKPGGTISVECAPSPPDSIRISVRDTGEGMTPEQLAGLFEPFNRLGKEGGVVEGTGIGLVVSKRLIELLGGTIGVESVVGVGSVFWIEMKLTTATQLANQNTGSAALAGPHETGSAPQSTLLYVEDNPANLALVEEIIARRPDLRLLSAADGSIGIEFALAYQPDVILMDINLPGINGIDAMKILRADPSTAHIPIIALSANAMLDDVKQALAAGFFNYVTKPIRVGKLLEAVDVALKFAQTTPRRSGYKEQ